MKELKPCPFCGNYVISVFVANNMTLLECSNCGANVEAIGYDDSAEKLWNTRPAEDVEDFNYTKQKAKPAAEYLRRYQDWRTGKDERTMTEAGIDPKELTKAINQILDFFDEKGGEE